MVVSLEGDKLTLSVDGKDKTMTVPAGAMVMLDGKDAKLGDLKKDQKATVTMTGEKVTKVEAKSK